MFGSAQGNYKVLNQQHGQAAERLRKVVSTAIVFMHQDISQMSLITAELTDPDISPIMRLFGNGSKYLSINKVDKPPL
jgi:hypothetical protein